jgi:drug/metabolite transporter (DMT)-like permease
MTNSTQSNPSELTTIKIVAAFLAIYVIWGTTFLAIRFAVATIPPFLMAGLRFFVAGAVMLVILLVRGSRLPEARYWRSAFLVGGLMMGGIGLVSFAEQRIASGVAALASSTIPIWMVVLEWLVFHGKRPTIQTFVGLGMGFAGAVLLFAPALSIRAGTGDLISMVVVLLGAVSFAVGSLASRHVPMPSDSRMSTATEMAAGGQLLLIVSVAVGEPSRVDLAAITLQSVLALVYLTVFGSIITYTAYLWLLKTVEPAKVSTNFYVNPVIAVLAGWLIADEALTMHMLIAAGLILCGVAIINVKLPRITPIRKGVYEINME